MRNNSYYTPTAQLKECGQPLAQWQAAGRDVGSTVHAIPADGVIIGWARELLGF